jgi:hypothetical protein
MRIEFSGCLSRDQSMKGIKNFNCQLIIKIQSRKQKKCEFNSIDHENNDKISRNIKNQNLNDNF